MTALKFRWLVALFILAAAGVQADPIGDAIGDTNRTADDKARDAKDHTAEVLAFFGVKPGIVVVDLFAGGGYYSELIGRIVGPTGKVYLYNNSGYAQYAAKPLAARVDSGRMQNVVVIGKEVGEIGVPPNSVDLVLMSMSYHDLYFKDKGFDVDPAVLFGEVNKMLKKGGTLAIIDHVAAAGSGSSAAQELHRIDIAFAQKDIESRGFKLAGSADLLRRATDDHTKVVFDPAVRGQTDRFVQKYVKQ